MTKICKFFQSRGKNVENILCSLSFVDCCKKLEFTLIMPTKNYNKARKIVSKFTQIMVHGKISIQNTPEREKGKGNFILALLSLMTIKCRNERNFQAIFQTSSSFSSASTSLFIPLKIHKDIHTKTNNNCLVVESERGRERENAHASLKFHVL